MQHSSQVEDVGEVIPVAEVNGAVLALSLDTGEALDGEPENTSNNVKFGRAMKRTGSRRSRKLGRQLKRSKPSHNIQGVREAVIPATVVPEADTPIASTRNQKGNVSGNQ